MSSRFSISLICGPPPCTTTGLTLHCFISTTSRAKSARPVVAAHRVAAELDDDRRAVVALQVGQRLGERAGGGDPVPGLGDGLVHGGSPRRRDGPCPRAAPGYYRGRREYKEAARACSCVRHCSSCCWLGGCAAGPGPTPGRGDRRSGASRCSRRYDAIDAIDVDAERAAPTAWRSRRRCSARSADLQQAGCLTLLRRARPRGRRRPPVADGGAAIAPVGLHAGVVTSMEDDAAAQRLLRGARGAGAQHRRRRARAAHLPRAVRDRGRARPRRRALARRGRVRLALPGRLLMRRLAARAPGRAAPRRGCAAAPPARDPAICATLFQRYDTAARLYPVTRVRRGRRRRCRPGRCRAPAVALRGERLPDALGRPRRPAGAGRAAGALPDRRQRPGDPAGAGAPRHRHRRSATRPSSPATSAASATARAASAPRGSGGGSTSGRSPPRARSTRRSRWRARPGSSRPTRPSTRGSDDQSPATIRARRRWRAGCRGRCPSRPR